MKDNEENSEGSDVFNLILKLRKEKLFVRNEKLNIQKLNEQITNKTLDIIQSVWVTTKQRFLLCQREVASHNCQRIDSLHKSVFVEAKHELGFQASVKICTLLDIIRSNPKQVAKWLVVGEQILDETKQYACLLESIVSGLYACCVFPEDTKYMLVLLHELAKLEFDHCENPRRTIKQRTCSFKNLYFLFHEVLQPAKNFVNATFQMPILQVMAYTDYYLDMDPEKTVMRFNQIDNNPTNFKTLEDYRNEVTSKLAKFTNNFISSILENVYGFPKSIAWIIHNMSQIIEKSFGAKEANAIVTELLFTLYICPVILDPEQYGICNAQVTDITRHNLIQVGQILQSLALNKFENTDVRFMDLFELLDKSSFASFFEMLFYDVEGFTEPPIETSPSLNRGIFLFTGQELSNLVCFLQRVHTECGLNNFNSVSIEELLSALSGPLSRDNSPKSSRPSSHEISESVPKKSNFFHMGGKNHHTKSSPDDVKTSNDVVLVFPVDSYHCEPVGLLSEDKVLKMSTMAVKNDEIFSTAPAKLNENVIQNGHIKQAYPSYADEGSIGNTSDNLEAISEAASNHSVASSLELENEDQNDNLSDMVSANVSGRGTPNISGRDTPSSQVNENEDRGAIEARQADIAQPQPQISRQIRSEIDDKFCKFEIKKLIEGDETISIISETWSTDVLASDNETVDASEGRHERTGLQLVDQAIHEVPIGNILDISETQSESAWSTDVMTSDTERLTEVDNDDAGSVAQSDDTNSVARSDDIRSETDENAPASLRRLSSISNSYGSNLPSSSTNYTGGSNSSGSFEEYRKVELKNGKIYHSEQLTTAQTDNNANNVVFKSLTMSADTQQITHNSVSYSEHTTSDIKTSNSVFSKSSSSVTTLINNRVQTVKEGDLIDIAGPSGLGLNKRESDAASYLKQSRVPKKFEDRPNEILLSNCSLNSSSSGSSSNSFENKNSHNENSEQWENKQWLNSSGSSLNVTLTPSESTSELSVLSVSNMNNPGNMLHKKSVTLRNLKPSTSTGAIPKSISFDMTADKGLDDEHRNKRGSFFGKLKMGFKNRRTKASFRNHEDFSMEGEDYGVAKKVYGESPVKINNNNNIELPEDILAKYRTKPFAESSPIKENCDVTKSPKERNIGDSNTSSNNEVNSFNDIKKKLRLVLSNTSEIPHCVKTVRLCVKNKIETVLRLELGKARKLNEWSSSARISEAIRCVNLLNDTSCLKLLQSMKEDLLLRSTYVQYLICSRQELLFCDMYLNSLQQQISDEKEQCEKYLATVCVREFLAENEDLILRFCEEFKQLSLADEKCDFLQNFYSKLFAIMNGTSPWQDVFLSRETEIEVTLERMIMSKIYKNSIYPNGDGDRDRDFILHEHIAKLSKIITPYHKDLMIHKMYLRECPWLPAQDALKGLNACRTPRDKVNCVVHCAKCIMDLLALSQSHGSTTADDFTPVLVYVIIKVNPEALLSTIQFVNSFLNNQLFGEDQYWWTQFCASVEYIKNMDYSD